MANANYRLTREQERALIRAHLGLEQLQLIFHGLHVYNTSEQDDYRLNDTGHVLAQALIDKKRSQAEALWHFSELHSCAPGYTAFRDRRVVRQWEKKYAIPASAKVSGILGWWARKLEAEARGA